EPVVNSSDSPVHLYDASAAGFGPPDVTLVGQSTGAVRGSLLLNATSTGFTLIKTSTASGGGTGGLLAPDTYTVTLVSGVTAFHGAAGGPLGGNGISPSNYTTTFTVAASTAVVVSLPDFARGPDSAHAINVPNNSANGIPIALSNGAGVTSGTFTLQYDPT